MSAAEPATPVGASSCADCGRMQYVYDYNIDPARHVVKLHLACPVCLGENSERLIEIQLVSDAMENPVILYVQALLRFSEAKQRASEHQPENLLELKRTMEVAWAAIPENQRGVLRPPDYYD